MKVDAPVLEAIPAVVAHTEDRRERDEQLLIADGAVDLRIPAGAGGTRKLRLKGRGIPGEKPGDLFVTPVISVPPADGESAKALYRKMQQELAYNPRDKLGV